MSNPADPPSAPPAVERIAQIRNKARVWLDRADGNLLGWDNLPAIPTELVREMAVELDRLTTRLAALEQQQKELLRIEPLHGPDCPVKPFEDSVIEIPDDVACTCGDLSHRWKARAIVSHVGRRLAEGRLEVAEARIAALERAYDGFF